MISINIQRRRHVRILAVFSYRYDAHLISDLITNISPIVDGWIAFDDRSATDVFSDEVERRLSLLEAAREAGASWVLAVDPDERFESSLEDHIVSLMDRPDACVYTFPLREMFSPFQYRVDGLWGTKRQSRLLNLRHGIVRPVGVLHLPWSKFIPDAQLHHTDINLYHLKMISPNRRKARADLYNYIDPGSKMQTFGYDYLADDSNMVLETIAANRGYFPPHEEDDGLWMPKIDV